MTVKFHVLAIFLQMSSLKALTEQMIKRIPFQKKKKKLKTADIQRYGMFEPLKWYCKLNFVYKRTPAAFVRVSLCEKKACFLYIQWKVYASCSF